MSAPDCPDVSAVDQLEQDLRDLAKSLGVDPDAPDVVVQFAAALLLATLRLVSLGQSQPTKSRRKPTWRAGLYEELYRDVNHTMADLNCSIKDAIARLREDTNGPWWRYTQQSLEPRYREACRCARDASRDRIARLLVQQAPPFQA
jgi:hypothetical protein